jgi:hypothetical protein
MPIFIFFSGGPSKEFGPPLCLAINMLPFNSALTFLDITGNEIGDQGITALGNALRKNRSLVGVHLGKPEISQKFHYLDDNLVTPLGWQGFRGCLYGNTKLVDVPFPQNDFDRYWKWVSDQTQNFTR